MSIISKASFVQIPSGYGEDKLYSEVPNTTNGDFQFTRASTGTRVNADGYIEEVPYNLITYSEDFTSTPYTRYAGSTAAFHPTILSPSGNLDSTLISMPNSNQAVFINNASLVSTGSTKSIYARTVSGTGKMNLLRLYNSTGYSQDNGLYDLTEEWQRFEITNDGTATNDGYFLVADRRGSGVNLTEVLVWGAMINKGTSAKTYIKTTDRLNVPRLDYTNRDCPQILIEKQATNLVTYSEDLDNAWWQKVNATINSNNIVSPDGTINADALVDDTTYGVHRVNTSNINITSGTLYTFSGFVKSGSVDFLHISPSSGQFSSNNTTVINMSNGTLVSKEHSGAVFIEDYGNGWYRFSVTLSAISSSLYSKQYFNPSSSSTSPIYTGTNEISCYMWGLQVESKYGNQGFKPTSYIPTNGTSVTRNFDYFKSGDLTSVLNTSQGVLFLDFLHYDSIVYGEFTVRPTDNSSANQLYFRTQNINNPDRNITQFSLTASGTTYGNYQFNDAYINMRIKYAFAWNGNVIKHYINGVKKSETTATFSFNADFGEIKMSKKNTPKQYLGFHNPLRQVAYFNEMLTDDELEELTTI